MRLKLAGKLLIFLDSAVRQMRLCVRQPCVKVFSNGFLVLYGLAGDGSNKIIRDGLCRVRLHDQSKPRQFRFGVGLFGCL